MPLDFFSQITMTLWRPPRDVTLSHKMFKPNSARILKLKLGLSLEGSISSPGLLVGKVWLQKFRATKVASQYLKSLIVQEHSHSRWKTFESSSVWKRLRRNTLFCTLASHWWCRVWIFYLMFSFLLQGCKPSLGQLFERFRCCPKARFQASCPCPIKIAVLWLYAELSYSFISTIITLKTSQCSSSSK